MGVALGANAHLVKPLREDEVVGTVKYWVGTPATVLIVDDQIDARHVLRTMLEGAGCDVLEATNGAEGLNMVHQGTPDLLILDLMMPVMDGFEVLRRLRADPAWHTLPVVIVTAKDLSSEERQWLLERSQLCIQKSQLTPAEFLAYVRQLIHKEHPDE